MQYYTQKVVINMSKQSNQKYRKELEKKNKVSNSIESSNSMNSANKEEVQYGSDNVKAPSDCTNNVNLKLK